MTSYSIHFSKVNLFLYPKSMLAFTSQTPSIFNIFLFLQQYSNVGDAMRAHPDTNIWIKLSSPLLYRSVRVGDAGRPALRDGAGGRTAKTSILGWLLYFSTVHGFFTMWITRQEEYVNSTFLHFPQIPPALKSFTRL